MDVPEANVPNPGETPRQSEVCYRERRSIRRCPTTVQQGPLKPALAQAIWRQRFISHGAGATTSPMPLRTSFAAPTGCSALATPPSLTPPSLVGGQDVRTSIHHLTLRTPRPAITHTNGRFGCEIFPPGHCLITIALTPVCPSDRYAGTRSITQTYHPPAGRRAIEARTQHLA